jgi:hypothetical protein
MTTRRWLLLSAAGVAATLFAGRLLSGLYAEWSWYDAMGALPLYESALRHTLALKGGALLIGFVLACANLFAVRMSIVSVVLPRRLGNLDIGEAVPARMLNLFVVGASTCIALSLALAIDDWTGFALARFGIPFNELDPYLDRDLGFYVYRLPFERALFLWSLLSLLSVGLLVVLVYAITPSLRMQKGRVYVSTYVRRHLSVLAACALLLVAWSYRIDALSLLANGSGPGGAFVAFDHDLLLPLLTTLSAGTVVVAFLVLWAGWFGHRRVALLAVTALLIAGPGARAMLPPFVRWASPAEDIRNRDRPYLSTHTLFTRRAFGIDEIIHADSAAIPLPSAADAARGVSSWDAAVLARAAPSVPRDATVPAIAWSITDEGLVATVAARALSDQATWTLSTLDVAAADERGAPLPAIGRSVGAVPALLVGPGFTRPLVVSDSLDRIPAPHFASWTERLAHAWSLQSPRLLAVGTRDLVRPRILLARDVRERITAVAPFLTIGPSLQMITIGDTLFWSAELFALSDDYPLADSIPFAGRYPRYAHRSATALVQAHTGRVRLVAAPVADPITRSWMRHYPWLFTSAGNLTSALAAQSPPPVDLLALQSTALTHTSFPRDSVFPKKLAPSNESVLGGAGAGATLFAQQGGKGPLAESQLLLDGDDLVAGLLVARGGDWPRIEWYPLATHPRWAKVLEQLGGAGQERPASPRGELRRGEIQVIPTREGALFTQAFYQWHSDGPPTLNGVATLVGGSPARSAPTLEEVFGGAGSHPATGPEAIRGRVTLLYDQMSTAMRRGDWPAFGRAYEELGRLLKRAPR